MSCGDFSTGLKTVQKVSHPGQCRIREILNPGNNISEELVVSHGGGLFCFWRIGEPHEIIQGNAIKLAKLDGGLDLRGRLSVLPREDGLLGNIQAVPEFDLGQAVLLAKLFKSVLGHCFTALSKDIPILYSLQL